MTAQDRGHPSPSRHAMACTRSVRRRGIAGGTRPDGAVHGGGFGTRRARLSEEDRGAAGELRASAIGPDLLDFEEEEEGRPVWDGEEDFTVREAHPEQAVRLYPRLVPLHECAGRKAMGSGAPPSRFSQAQCSEDPFQGPELVLSKA